MEHKELITDTDHNMNLLNSTRHKLTELDIILGYNLSPLISRLTRVTQQSTTLIDNIIVSEQLHKSFDSSILISDISHHLLMVALLKQKY